jgi:CHAT domain-containing protein
VTETPAADAGEGTRPGLYVWAEQGRDRRRFFGEGEETVARITSLAAPLPIPPAHLTPAAALVAPFPATPTDRAAAFLTPGDGQTLLQPCPVFRRLPRGKGPPFPPGAAVLTREGRTILRILFRDGQERVALTDLSGLPADLKEGLRPGAYRLRIEGETAATTFAIAEVGRRSIVMKPLEELAGLLENRTDPLFLQVAAEHLLAQRDRDNHSSPYLADALDVLESVAAEALTPCLRELHQRLLWRLGLRTAAGNTSAPDPDQATGIAAIDRARQLLAAAHWADALAVLQSMKPDDDTPAGRRARGLGALYRGVIVAESGLETEGPAGRLFEQALADLAEGTVADQYRAHNEYADFLLGRVEERLSDQAVETAAGVPHPLLTALRDWCAARRQYETAGQFAQRLGPVPRTAVRVNLARSYALLADLIGTLDPPVDGRRRFAAGERAALRTARELAGQALSGRPAAELPARVRGVAEETRADVAFREGDLAECLRRAKRARDAFVQAGALTGVESVLHLTGLCHLSRFRAGEVGQAAEAVRDLRLSECLGEALAARVPVGRTDRRLAGFFARRAAVGEWLVELLLATGRDAEALRFAERAKARALRRVLTAEGAAAGAASPPADLPAVLRHWPREVAALEYFLGRERAWVFVVSRGGRVKGLMLQDRRGQPLPPADLIARVRCFLDQTRHQAAKMSRRLSHGQGFDHSWQDTLHDFYDVLIPAPVREELRGAATLLIVPHHVLHYFPFAALVTRCDTAKRDPQEMVQPRFLIDEPLALCYAPSLADWNLLRQRPNRPLTRVSALAIPDLTGAPRLPGATADVANLKAAFGSRVATVRVGAAATEGMAWSLLDSPGVVLLATHGTNVPDRPLQSRLYLYPDGKNDGWVTAAKVYRRPVRADLVVLSACYSGLSERSPLPGDDLFGLQRGLLQSGARTVVSGLWDVYDGTGPDLTRGLFAGLAAGGSAPAALAGAQRAFLATQRRSRDTKFFLHPYFWAVYAVHGDDRTGRPTDRLPPTGSDPVGNNLALTKPSPQGNGCLLGSTLEHRISRRKNPSRRLLP